MSCASSRSVAAAEALLGVEAGGASTPIMHALRSLPARQRVAIAKIIGQRRDPPLIPSGTLAAIDFERFFASEEFDAARDQVAVQLLSLELVRVGVLAALGPGGDRIWRAACGEQNQRGRPLAGSTRRHAKQIRERLLGNPDLREAMQVASQVRVILETI